MWGEVPAVVATEAWVGRVRLRNFRNSDLHLEMFLYQKRENPLPKGNASLSYLPLKVRESGGKPCVRAPARPPVPKPPPPASEVQDAAELERRRLRGLAWIAELRRSLG